MSTIPWASAGTSFMLHTPTVLPAKMRSTLLGSLNVTARPYAVTGSLLLLLAWVDTLMMTRLGSALVTTWNRLSLAKMSVVRQ